MSFELWEAKIGALRKRPENETLVKECYWDDPLFDSELRFEASNEWHAVKGLLAGKRGTLLDIGAGRGHASISFARLGLVVTALEPNPGAIAGCDAINQMALAFSTPVKVVQGSAECMPFEDASFDVVYCRSVLHHAKDLRLMCLEIARVLKPAGVFLACREHVVSTREEVALFLSAHALQPRSGEENAYMLNEYKAAMEIAGLNIRCVMGPYDSAINYFPWSDEDRWGICCKPLIKIVGWKIARAIVNPSGSAGRMFLQLLGKLASRRCRVPGRMYTFLADKT